MHFEEIAILKMRVEMMVGRESQQWAEFAQRESNHKATVSSLWMEIKGLITRLHTQEVEMATLHSRNMSYSDCLVCLQLFLLPINPISPALLACQPRTRSDLNVPHLWFLLSCYLRRNQQSSLLHRCISVPLLIRNPQSLPSHHHAGISQPMPVPVPQWDNEVWSVVCYR
jgi:hypothetical protein